MTEFTLSPCPFCGGKAEICGSIDPEDNTRWWWVECAQCSGRSGKCAEPETTYENYMYANMMDTLHRAVEGWNERSGS